MLAHGVDPAAQDNYGMTGLQWAEANGHRDVVEVLTEQS
jgi:ankyrin repeat protein